MTSLYSFLRDTLIVLGFTALLWALLPAPPPYFEDKSYKCHYLEEHADDIRTLFLGNSLFESGVDPHVLGDSLFLAASSGRIIWYDIQMAKRYIPHMPNLKTVFYPLLHCINDHGRLYNNLSLSQSYAQEYYATTQLPPPPQVAATMTLPGTSLPRIGRYVVELTVDSLGFLPLDGHPGGRFMVPNYDQSMSDSVASQLAALAAVCRDYGLRFVVLTTPYSSEFIAGMPPESLDSMHAVIDKAQARLGDTFTIEYHDYIDHPDFRDTSLYYNWNHLNREGARLFALRLKADFGL